MPPALWPSDAVPPLLSDVLAQAALDEAFCACWPAFRPAVAGFVEAVRPDVAATLAAAAKLGEATAAAEAAAAQVGRALSTANQTAR